MSALYLVGAIVGYLGVTMGLAWAMPARHKMPKWVGDAVSLLFVGWLPLFALLGLALSAFFYSRWLLLGLPLPSEFYDQSEPYWS